MNSWARLSWFLAGAGAAVATALGVLAWRFYTIDRWWRPPTEWSSIGPIAVSPRWSVVLEEKGRHPFLAEYDYQLQVYKSHDRDGTHHGSVTLLPNSGGRTYLCVYVLTGPRDELVLELGDRVEASFVDLSGLRRLREGPSNYKRRYLGSFQEEAAPLRFVPATVQSTCPTDR
jgi:hypothetical protein